MATLIVQRERRRVTAVLMLVAVLTPVPLAAAAVELVGPESALVADAQDGHFDQHSLLDAALIASGVLVTKQRTAYYSRLDQLAATLNEPPAGDVVDAVDRQAERVLRCLHRELLRGSYDAQCTEVQRAFDDGDYNCVTATVLFYCLCQRSRLDPVAVATSTHVRCRFPGDVPLDVETTCADWFARPADVRTELTGTRPITSVQLVGKIYYNRGVALLESRQYRSAIRLLRLSRLFDPHDDSSEQNLLAAINNWALADCDAGRYSAAASLIEQGLHEHPDYAPLQANDLYIHQRWAVSLCRQHDFAQALQVLQDAYHRRPDVELFDRGRQAVCHEWAQWLLGEQRVAEAQQVLDNAARLDALPTG